jgi:hypothetical protein
MCQGRCGYRVRHCLWDILRDPQGTRPTGSSTDVDTSLVADFGTDYFTDSFRVLAMGPLLGARAITGVGDVGSPAKVVDACHHLAQVPELAARPKAEHEAKNSELSDG